MDTFLTSCASRLGYREVDAVRIFYSAVGRGVA